MTAREIFDMYCSGIFPVLECNRGINRLEVDPNVGMRGKLKGIDIMDKDEDTEHLLFIIDFGLYEEINKLLAKAKYYNQSFILCETWFEQEWYQRKNIE